MSTFDHIKFGDNLEVTDEGSGVIRVDASGIAPSVGVGAVELIYKYEVAGVDKASIDTGADTASAGSLDWTNGDVLEVFFLGRTDEAGTNLGSVGVRFNNDSGANYDESQFQNTNTTLAGATILAATEIVPSIHGNASNANYPGVFRMTIQAYTNTTFYKCCEYTTGTPDATAATARIRMKAATWRNTAAITRLAVLATAGGAKLKVGSQLLIYKRRNA